MRKLMALAVFCLTGCGMLPTPNDFPPPPMTIIVEVPPITVTATMEPYMRPILSDDIQDAETFFLILQTALVAGDDVGISERIKYPIRVKLNGRELTLNTQDEFLDQYRKIFDQAFVTSLYELDESKLTLLPNGVQVGDGELWFNYFCVDAACSASKFLITQINR